jgi:arylsulfatase A-like enzyme
MAQSLRSEDVTVATVLKQAGYRTGLIGKWGLGDVKTAEPGLPERHGFEHAFGYLNQHHAHNYYPEFLWRNGDRVSLRNVVTNNPGVAGSGAGVASVRLDYTPDLFAEEALRFVRERRDQSFFLYLALTAPHANNEAGRRGMEVPELGEYAALDWPDPQKGHAAMITRMDRDVGRLLDLLRDLGLEKDTLVVFTSDNGPHREGGNDPAFNRSSGALRGIKRDHYEGGIRVPMIVRWPGQVPAGRVDSSVWWFADVLPTLAEVAGAAVPPGVDGISVMKTWKGGSQPELAERFLYWEFHEGGFKQAGRWKDWKIVRNRRGGSSELYDLSRDVSETTDVAGLHPELVAQLEGRLNAARTDSPDWPVK